ncbi:AIPR family protein [Duganella sp. Leaf61]|uniref:AIPR family protein n=1 Tax=Duganella sp. Leaf61 TaxID=1736227 RepID=UPI0009EAF7BE|nr:AIPR family protein [Duganella sp. Leaf61]
MSVILTTRIKNHIESSLQDLLFLKDTAGDLSKMYSRGLVAICLSGLSGQPYKNIVDFIIDGSKDNGIDGAFYDPARNKLYLVQAKWSAKGTGTIDTGEIRKFIAGVYDLLNEDWKKFNSRMGSISPQIAVGIRSDPQIVLVAAFNSENPISGECQSIIDDFLNENNGDAQEVVTFKSFNLRNLIRTIKSAKSGAKTDIDVNLLQWGDQKDPYYSVYGKVSCADIAEWHKEHEDLLFTENIRSALSDSEINAHIEETLINSPTEFWYLNNGITAIADSISRKPIGLGDQKDSSYWSVGNIKIVNGAQTTSSIARAYLKSPSEVKKGYVQIKIISLDKAPIDIANKITTATNTQNRVEPKDFLALEAVQDGIAEAFSAMGVQYCYRRGEKVRDKTKGLDVQELAMTIAICGENVASVVVAKRNAGSLTDPNGHYQKLFDRNIVAKDMWADVQKHRLASEAISNFMKDKTGRDEQLAVHGNRFIEHLMLRSGTKKINSIEVGKIHSELKNIIEENYKDCYLAVLFKNAKKCSAIREIYFKRI